MTLVAPRVERHIAGAAVDLDALFQGRLDDSPRDEEALTRYKARVQKREGWWDEVARHVDGVRWSAAPIVFALPTRNRTSTSRAIDVLRAACEEARFVVLHNFVEPPPPAVSRDLDGLREAHDVLLIEREVDATWTIGAIRALAVDIALSLGAPLVGSADSDISGFLDGATYERALVALADRGVDATTHRRYVELEGLAPDVNLLLLGMVDNLRAHVRAFEMRATANVVGAAAVFRAASLCHVGGIPPVAVGEDLVMQDAFHRLRGRAGSTITIQENGVFTDHRAQYQDARHYEDWAADTVHGTATVPRVDALRAQAQGFLARAVATIYLDAVALAPDQGPRLMGESTTAWLRLSRIAQALPGMSPGSRAEIARQAMRAPRSIPEC